MSDNTHFNRDKKFKKLLFENLPNRINIESIVDDIEGFRLVVKEEFCSDAVRYLISFDDVEQYVVTPNFPYNSLDIFESSSWPIYKFAHNQSSNLIRRYHEETSDMYITWDISHYVIMGVNDGIGCVEILSQDDPIITLLPDKIRCNIKTN